MVTVDQAGPADMLLTRAAAYTVDARRPWAEAVAIRKGRIVAVGSDSEIRGMAGPFTRVQDLAGRMVLPGFQDAHIHPVMGGLDKTRCDLHGVTTVAEYLGLIGSYAVANPAASWIRGRGWSMSAFPGGAPGSDALHALDALVPERPVFLESRDGHAIWVNTHALRLAAIDASTPDPPGGRIERDLAGAPTGGLHELAIEMVSRLLPPVSPAEREAALLLAQAELHRLGITGWQDATVSPHLLEAYRALAERGELTARVIAAQEWPDNLPEKRFGSFVDELIDRRRWASVGRLRAPAVKIYQDGVCENFTASMLAPYLDQEGKSTANRGESLVEPELLKRAVTLLDAEGFQVHVHAVGDRAIREALDAFEEARRVNGARDARHHIAHLQVIHPDDVPRFGALGVVANGQPYWARLADDQRNLTIPFLGPERAAWQYPFRSLLRADATLAFGSDWTVSTANPLIEMEVAVTRVPPDDRGAEPFFPAERISLEEAIRAFTLGSAFVNHLDDSTGSIQVGKLADLVVLDRNLFDPGAGPIGDARVALTLVEGQPVFAEPQMV